jgi:hypothetical protein
VNTDTIEIDFHLSLDTINDHCQYLPFASLDAISRRGRLDRARSIKSVQSSVNINPKLTLQREEEEGQEEVSSFIRPSILFLFARAGRW